MPSQVYKSEMSQESFTSAFGYRLSEIAAPSVSHLSATERDLARREWPERLASRALTDLGAPAVELLAEERAALGIVIQNIRLG